MNSSALVMPGNEMIGLAVLGQGSVDAFRCRLEGALQAARDRIGSASACAAR